MKDSCVCVTKCGGLVYMIVEFQNAQTAVIIVNYNGQLDTEECIKSLRKCSTEIGVVIIDNASYNSDFEKLKDKCKDCMLLRLKENLGFAGGNNYAIQHILSYDNIENLLFLNNDTVIQFNMIEELLNYLKEDIIISPKMLYYNSPDYIWYGGGHFNKYTGRAIHENINKKNWGDFEIRECSFTSGCCFMIKRETLKKIGLLNDSYFMYCEDSEFCLRAQMNNVRILYNPNAVLYHKVSKSTGGGDSAFCLYYMTRNRLRYITEYSNYFSFIAIVFTYLSRYIRIMQYWLHHKDKSKAIKMGIVDYRRKKTGKCSDF